MSKSPDAFRTISEVADWLDTPAHVLRFWESKFSQVKPIKRAGGRRYYRPADMQLLGGIKRLLHQDGLTIKEVQLLLREKGAKHVSALSSFDIDADSDTTTIEAAEQIEVDAAPSDEPVFTSIAPRTDVKPAPAGDDAEDDDQMFFPGFEFASDRTKTFERSKTPKLSKIKPQAIDISHIPLIQPASITTNQSGILSALSKLSVADVSENAAKIKDLKAELQLIANSRAGISDS